MPISEASRQSPAGLSFITAGTSDELEINKKVDQGHFLTIAFYPRIRPMVIKVVMDTER